MIMCERTTKSIVAGGRDAMIGLGKHNDARIAGGKAGQNLACRVGRTIVDRQHFKVGERLRQHALQRGGDVGRHVEAGHDDAGNRVHGPLL